MLGLADWEEERMANHERRCREAVQSFMGDRRQPNVPLAERLLASRMGYEARRQLNQPFQITVIHRHTDSEGQHDTYYPLMVRPYTTLWQIKRMMSSLQNIEPQHIHFEIDGVSCSCDMLREYDPYRGDFRIISTVKPEEELLDDDDYTIPPILPLQREEKNKTDLTENAERIREMTINWLRVNMANLRFLLSLPPPTEEQEITVRQLVAWEKDLANFQAQRQAKLHRYIMWEMDDKRMTAEAPSHLREECEVTQSGDFCRLCSFRANMMNSMRRAPILTTELLAALRASSVPH